MSDDYNIMVEEQKVQNWIDKKRIEAATLRVQKRFGEASLLAGRIAEAEQTLAKFRAGREASK